MDEHEPSIHWFDTFISDEELIDDYNEKEGTRLDPAKIHRNQSGGDCNKVLLSSPWGWFSMRSPTPSYHHRFTQLMFRDQYEVLSFVASLMMLLWCSVVMLMAEGPAWRMSLWVPWLRLMQARVVWFDRQTTRVSFVLGSKQCYFHLSARWVGPCLGSLPQRADWRDEWTVAMEREGRITSQSLSLGFQNATLATQWQKADKAQWSTGYHSRQFQCHQKFNNSQEIYTRHLFSTSDINNHIANDFGKTVQISGHLNSVLHILHTIHSEQ